MRASWKKTVVGSLAALAIGISTVASVAPASAQNWKHGQQPAPGGGHGNFHGNGGGGHHGHGGGGGWGPAAVGLGILGLAAGAAIATQPEYSEDSCEQYQPVYDPYGNYMGRRLVYVC